MEQAIIKLRKEKSTIAIINCDGEIEENYLGANLNLRSVTREIIQMVETESGIPVRVMEDPNLPTKAAVKMARLNSLPMHLVQY